VSSIHTNQVKIQASKKVALGIPARRQKRAALIERLCESLGAEYRDLKQYRSL
jgi:hypothetical protein